jgi:hypothetical protein
MRSSTEFAVITNHDLVVGITRIMLAVQARRASVAIANGLAPA